MRNDLSAEFLAELNRNGRMPVQYLVFHFQDADVILTDGSGVGHVPGAEILIEDWGELNDTVDIHASVRGDGLPTRQATITMINKRDNPFSARFNTEPPENVKVDFYQRLTGITEEVLIDVFIIQDPISYSEASALLSLDLVSANQYADPHVGTLDPVTNNFFGVGLGTIDGVVGTPYSDQCPITHLDGAVAAAATTINCTDDLLSIGFTPGGGTVVVGDFGFSYSGISGNSFTGCSNVAAMPDNALAFEYLQDFTFAFGAGPVASAGPVTLNGQQYLHSHTIYKDLNPVQVVFHDWPPYTREEAWDTFNYTEELDLENSGYWPDQANHVAFVDYGGATSCEAHDPQRNFYIAEKNPEYAGEKSISLQRGSHALPAGAVITYGTLEVWLTLSWHGEDADIGAGYHNYNLRILNKNFSGQVASGVLTIHKEVSDNFNLSDWNATHTVWADFFAYGYLQKTAGITGAWFLKSYCVKSNVNYKVMRNGYPIITYYVDPVIQVTSGEGTTNPAQAIASIFSLIGVGSFIDPVTFAAAETWFDLHGYAFEGWIPGEARCREVIKDMCTQSRSRVIYNAGKIKLLVRQPLADKTTVFTADTGNTRMRSISVVRQNINDITNSIISRYNRDGVDGDYLSTYEVADQDSIDRIGKQESVDDLYLITDAAMAADVSDFWLERRKMPYNIITLSLYLEAFPLEIGDAVLLQTPFSGFLSYKTDISGITRKFGSGKTGAITLFELTLKSNILS